MPFEFEGHSVRIVIVNGEPWWVVNDVCAILGIADPHRAASRIDGADRRQTPVRSGDQDRRMWVVNEPGLYELIFRSDKPAARGFRRWVTTTVLPQIRKTGSYAPSLSPAELLVAQAQRLLEQERRLASIEGAQEQRDDEVRELTARMDDVQQKTDWYTALAYAKREGLLTNHQYLNRLGRAAAAIVRASGEEPGKVYNELYGEVNSYPEWALSEAAGGLA